MSPIKRPFGTDLNADFFGFATLPKVAGTASGVVKRNISTPMSFLRIGTATKSKTLRVFPNSSLPAGSVLLINAQSASSRLLLGSGFSIQNFINSATANKGTGNWIVKFFYNGSSFVPTSKPTRVNIRKSI